jgi:hypothetical protein
MRFLTLMIAVMALLSVTYIRFKAPSYGAVFGDDATVARLDGVKVPHR